MPGRRNGNGERARQTLAQEAARIIVEQGIRDYRVAKQKAAERLGINGRGALPGNAEIERAVSEHLSLFRGDSHANHLRLMRETALEAMRMLSAFRPRLVGPVLQGTADENSAVNLHVFADSPESVAVELDSLGYACRHYERRLRTSRGRGARPQTFSGYQFKLEDAVVEATVFPIDGIRQAPISPIDGRPMKRADCKAVESLLSASL
ncbi:MAG: hypothetical protein GTO71_06355 [Woeseiaceae bacterium]|nr:hypothetical protein [Woeseiaceae bacterium]NIP20718.1 hypothetical protein [Woeseiaceae bacterium]NIS89511.1 hypothetical protein [Woeseiaceae bacterium]